MAGSFFSGWLIMARSSGYVIYNGTIADVKAGRSSFGSGRTEVCGCEPATTVDQDRLAERGVKPCGRGEGRALSAGGAGRVGEGGERVWKIEA